MIQYLTGDATYPAYKGNKIICSVSNNIGKWGKGFVLALLKRWPATKQQYLQWAEAVQKDLPLGEVQFVQVETNILVANMIAQKGIRSHPGALPPIRYEALRECLKRVKERALETGSKIHMPRIGCGLAGGEWKIVEEIIGDELLRYGIDVYVYDLKQV